MDLSEYFLSIQGSPKIKSDIVKTILASNNYKKEETILIGDSINDYEAANVNGIKFYGYNNEKLRGLDGYIEKFEDNFTNDY